MPNSMDPGATTGIVYGPQCGGYDGIAVNHEAGSAVPHNPRTLLHAVPLSPSIIRFHDNCD